MRLIIIVAVILVLIWLGYETRSKSKDFSNACYGVSGLFVVLLIAVWIVGSPD